MRRVFAAIAITVVLGCGKPAPETGPIDVTVYDSIGVAAGVVDVVLHNADGGVLEHIRTESDGTAHFDGAPRDSMVTVALRDGLPYHLQTITGLQPGDVIQFGEEASDPTLASVNVSFFVQHPTAKSYVIDAGCHVEVLEDYVPTHTFDVPRGCADGAGNISLVTYATDEDSVIHGYAFLTDIPLATGQTVVNLPDWVNDRTTFNVDIPFVPWGDIGYTRARFLTQTDSFVGSATIALDDFERSYVIDSTDAIESDYSLPTGFQQALGYSIEIRGADRTAFVVTRDDLQPAQLTFDVEKDFAPFPLDVDFSLFNADLNPTGRPAVAWGVQEETPNSVAGLELAWADGVGQPVEFRWDIVAPSTTVAITAPAMPSELQRFIPLPGDEYRTAAVWLRDADFLTDYRDYFRYQPLFEDPTRRFSAFPATFEMRSSTELEEF